MHPNLLPSTSRFRKNVYVKTNRGCFVKFQITSVHLVTESTIRDKIS